MWNKQIKLLFCFYFSILLFSAEGQVQRFELGLIGGLNLSELSGDDIGSYFGLNTGLKISTNLKPRLNISTELIYSQAGEYVLPIAYPLTNFGKIRLNYLEVPLYLTLLGFPKEDFFQKNLVLG